MADDVVTQLRDMATDHARHRTHYEGCADLHIECAALRVCDKIERLNAAGILDEIERLRAENNYLANRLAAVRSSPMRRSI